MRDQYRNRDNAMGTILELENLSNRHTHEFVADIHSPQNPNLFTLEYETTKRAQEHESA